MTELNSNFDISNFERCAIPGRANDNSASHHRAAILKRNQLEGWKVDLGDQVVTLALQGLPLVAQQQSWRTRLLEVITNPNIALILMMIGVYGLILEFYNPGAIFPGLGISTST